MALNASALYVPVITPPTPAPSPGPSSQPSTSVLSLYKHEFSMLPPYQRRQFLSAILNDCTPDELLFVSTTVAPLLKRDFLRELPPELAIYVLSFISEPRSLLKAGEVSRYWHGLASEDCLWKAMCEAYDFHADDDDWEDVNVAYSHMQPPSPVSPNMNSPYLQPSVLSPPRKFSYYNHFKMSYECLTKWRIGGTLLRRIPLASHHHLPNDAMQPPVTNPASAVPTSIALDSDWLVIGLANSRIHIFSARTGVSCRTLVGHTAGVWAVALVRAGGERDDDAEIDERMRDMDILPPSTTPAGDQLSQAMRVALGLDPVPDEWPSGSKRPPRARGQRNSFTKPSEQSGTSDGWGQPNSLVVSGGCDKDLRVWDVKSGFCIYALKGHTSTIRCLKVLHNRPIAVTGSRDRTLRVWDIQRGRCLRVLEGHDESVRTLDVHGNRVASGSYDFTCRLWDIDTGECLHVLRGHHHQIYSVAFDGIRVVSGGMDTTVRVWDAETGACSALLQGHTALVCQVQLSNNILVTGGSDGRVIIFSMNPSASSTPSSTLTPAPTLLSFSPSPASDSDSSTTSHTRASPILQQTTRRRPTSCAYPSAAAEPRPVSIVQRLAAHDSSVTGLQFDSRFLVTGGNDGRVRLYELRKDGAGAGGKGIGGMFEYVREMSEACESVWKVAYTDQTCAVMCKRGGMTQVEIWSFRPSDVRD